MAENSYGAIEGVLVIQVLKMILDYFIFKDIGHKLDRGLEKNGERLDKQTDKINELKTTILLHDQKGQKNG